MKPRNEPRALTLKDVIAAAVLLVITLLCAGLTVAAGAAIGLPDRWILAIVIGLFLCYPLALNWTDMKASLRHRRGHCPACGYDRRGLPLAAACPECGTT